MNMDAATVAAIGVGVTATLGVSNLIQGVRRGKQTSRIEVNVDGKMTAALTEVEALKSLVEAMQADRVGEPSEEVAQAEAHAAEAARP